LVEEREQEFTGQKKLVEEGEQEFTPSVLIINTFLLELYYFPEYSVI
jgi:hypothetical protein